jgi:hypothetical protein
VGGAGTQWIVHLGMTGQLLVCPQKANLPNIPMPSCDLFPEGNCGLSIHAALEGLP